MRQRFDREAAALSVISSAHVVELISGGADEEGLPFLVLERLDGQNLQEVIAERGPMKPERVGRYDRAGRDRARARARARHRPSRSQAGEPVPPPVGDNAAHASRCSTSASSSIPADRTDRMRDAFGGTPLYMAPEQVRGQLTRIGPATDIYAIAQVTLTLLTGETYWTRRAPPTT